MSGGPEFRVDDLLARLPKGERLLWQGSPSRRALALHVFRVRAVAVYFGVLAFWRFISSLHDGNSVLDAAGHALWILPLALAGLGILAALAAGYAKTTRYVLTNRRLVIRSGIALPVTLNVPLSYVVDAALARRPDGSGDIPLRVHPDQRIAWLVLWPNARPWRFTSPEPMLRGIADPERVAGLVAGALQEAQAAAGNVSADVPAVSAASTSRGAAPALSTSAA